jgi:hypothetical protein
MEFLKNSGLLNSRFINPLTTNNNSTKKCKLEFTDEEKKKRMLIEYCKIISKNQNHVEDAFLKSFQQYSNEMFNNFNPKEFISFVQNHIIEYLKPAFEDNRFTQYAFMIDLKPLITEILTSIIREEIKKTANSKERNLDTTKIYNIFIERLRERANSKTIFLKKIAKTFKIFGGQSTPGQTQQPQQYLYYPQTQQPQQYMYYPQTQQPQQYLYYPQTQQSQQYMYYPQTQQYPSFITPSIPKISNASNTSIQNNNMNSVNISEKDEIKKITEVANFFKKNIDGNTVNDEILEIIKDTLRKALDTTKDKIYAPMIEIIKSKIKSAISEIGSFDTNIKIIMLVQMLEKSYDFIVNTIKEVINKVNDEYIQNPRLNVQKILNKKYDEIVFPPDITNIKTGGKRKNLKLRKTKKTKKSLRLLSKNNIM